MGWFKPTVPDYDALAWARIHALTGRPPETLYAWLTGDEP